MPTAAVVYGLMSGLMSRMNSGRMCADINSMLNSLVAYGMGTL